MLSPLIGATVGIIATLISAYLTARQRELTKNIRNAFFGAFLSFLIIYTIAIYFNVFATIEQSEYIIKIIISFYILFGIFITNLILLITKHRFAETFKEFFKNLKTDKLLVFYFIFMFFSIIFTFIISFSPRKEEIIFFSPPTLYKIYLGLILIVFPLYPISIIWKFLEKSPIKEKLKNIFLFFSLFYGIMVFAFIGFFYILSFKKDIFGIIYVVQGVLLLISVYNYRNIKVLLEYKKFREEEYRKFEEGTIYLIEEKKPKMIYDIYKELPKTHSLCITRTYPHNLKNKISVERFIWISVVEGGKIETIPPTNLARVLSEIKNFINENEESIIIIENLNYLIFQNNLDSVYKVVHSLAEITAINNCIVLISIDEKQIEKDEIIMLERECEVIRGG